MDKIIPSILTDHLEIAREQITKVRQNGSLSVVQLDIIDGWYADNLTLLPSDFIELGFGDLQVDFHLMTEEPLDFVFEIIEYGRDLPTRAIIAQIERMSNQASFCEQVKKNNFKVGLSLDLHTPAEALEVHQLSDVDFIQVMGIEAGFQGQKFVPSVLHVISDLVSLREKHQFNFSIMVDGGVTLENIQSILQSGAEIFSIGSQLWHASDFGKRLFEFDQLLVVQP